MSLNYLHHQRDSLDRFGDDLIELILGYIKFDDCFHFKCISKQWQRLIFNKQTEVIIYEFSSTINYIIHDHNYDYGDDNNNTNDSEEKFKAIELSLQMCPRIKSIELNSNLYFSNDYEYYSQIVPIVLKNCPSLSEICFSFQHLNDKILAKIIEQYSANLKIVKLYNSDNRCRVFLRQLPNLTHLIIDDIDNIATFKEQEFNFLKKLRHIEFRSYNSNDDIKNFELLFSNAKHLKSINISFFTKIDDTMLMALFDTYSKLKEIKVLDNQFYIELNNDLFIEQFNKFVGTAESLISIDLKFTDFTPNICLLEGFKQLNYLKHFSLFTNCTLANQMLYHFNPIVFIQLHNLTHLHIVCSKYRFNDIFFESIVEHMPKLQSIHLDFANPTDISLTRLTLLNKLEHIRFDYMINTKFF